MVGIQGHLFVDHANIIPELGQFFIPVVKKGFTVNKQGIALFNPDISKSPERIIGPVVMSRIAIQTGTVVPEPYVAYQKMIVGADGLVKIGAVGVFEKYSVSLGLQNERAEA